MNDSQTQTAAKQIFAMIHVAALPGTPRGGRPLAEIIEQAVGEARVYQTAGVDGLLLENMHDAPYLAGEAIGPEIVATMTAVGLAVRQAAPLPLGVQILAAGNRQALATALACGARYVRVENFAYAHVADEGLMPTAEAGPLLRYRKQIGAEHVRIIADVKKKHSSHAITADVSLTEAAETAAFFGADGLVVTGRATGRATATEDADAVRRATALPVWIGSGVTAENLAALWPCADAFIVGSYFKQDGVWSRPVDAARVRRFMETVGGLRESGA